MSEWISVKDRLPELDNLVLAWMSEPTGINIHYTIMRGWAVISYSKSVVTHWMPLPEPPEEVTDHG